MVGPAAHCLRLMLLFFYQMYYALEFQYKDTYEHLHPLNLVETMQSMLCLGLHSKLFPRFLLGNRCSVVDENALQGV